MTKLLQMSLNAATAVVRTSAQLVEIAIERVRGGGHRDADRWTPASPPPSMPVTQRQPWTDDGAPVAAPPASEVAEPAPPAPDPPEAPPVAEPAPPAPDPFEAPVVEPAPDPLEAPPVVEVAEPAPEPPPVAAVPEPPPPAPDPRDVAPIAPVPEPTPGEAALVREQQREAETTAESPGAEVHVDEPWQGYASMNAPEIIDRLAVSDDTVKAVVVLYESSHKGRKTVLRAAAR